MTTRTNRGKQVLKLVVVGVCLGGFSYQTLEFLFLYWTYPTVIDIQVSMPPEIEMPGITFCNPNGLKFDEVCKIGFCTPKNFLQIFKGVCKTFEDCVGKEWAADKQGIELHRFFSDLSEFNATIMETIRIPASNYFHCKIVSSGNKADCNMQNVIIASYFSDTIIPNFCYTINSLWGDPNRKIQKIKKTDTIELEIFIDSVHRPEWQDKVEADDILPPRYTVPSSSTTQLSIHSQYISDSPFAHGYYFIGGKKYRIKVKKDEKHLLPPPYATNCTDYIPLWKERGGYGPLNQMMVIEECKYNQSLERLGYVPFTVDYPHSDTICRFCDTCLNYTQIGENCTDLLKAYNQPCENIQYTIKIEEKIVYDIAYRHSQFLEKPQQFIRKRQGFNCSYEQTRLTKRCQTIWIELVFDGFDVTNLTYNAKFESLELFSVIGGYMGMYLGVSIVAVYDFAEIVIVGAHDFWRKYSQKRRHSQKIFHSKVQSQTVIDFERMKPLRERNVHKI